MTPEDTRDDRLARVTRRRSATRQRLIDAAYEVFLELGIHDAPIEAICERAGFTRGAFYSNFTSKEDLFLAIYQRQMQARLDRLQTVIDRAFCAFDLDTSGALSEAVEQACLLFAESLGADEQWFLLVAEFHAQAMRQPELRAPTEAAQTEFHIGLAQILERVLDRIGLRLILDSRDAGFVIVSLYKSALERAIFEGLHLGVDHRYLAEVLPRLILAMAVPQVPHR
ncbi:MAG: TetR/AcrR family transcriptional regulator [Micromonosporaceae bacterium]|nr:TetR/AcrR family transcriptional regulator [Micromonosporaceae bacterium]